MHEIVAKPPAVTRRRWAIGGLLSLMIVINYLERSNLGIALPGIRHDLSLSNLQVGMVLSGFQWTYALAQVPMGLVVDRFRPRRVVFAAGLVWSVFAAATGLATGLVFLIIVRAWVGLAESPMFPAGIKVVNSWFPTREKATAIGMYEIATQLGGTCAPLIAALLIRSAGWRLMFVLMAALGLVPLLLWWRFYRQPEDDKSLSADERVLILAGRENFSAEIPSLAEWASLFSHTQTWAMIAGGLSFAGLIGFYAWLPIYLQETRHLGIVAAGGSITFLGVFGISGVVAGSSLSDFLVRRGWKAFNARRSVVVAGSLVGAAAIGSTAVSDHYAVLFTALAAGSFCGGFNAASWWALAPAVAPNDRLVASLGSLQNGGAFLGAAIAPLVIGWLLDRHFEFRGIIAVSAAFGLLSAVIYGILLHRPIVPRANTQPV